MNEVNFLRPDPDKEFVDQMNLLGRTLTKYANDRLQAYSWLDEVSSDEEADEIYQKKLDELFDGQPYIDL